jgi:hypothetical protein
MSTKSVGLVQEQVTAAVARALRGLRFGSVEIVVHDGRVVQIERRERVRLEPADDRAPDDRRRNQSPDERTFRTAGGAASRSNEERSS